MDDNVGENITPQGIQQKKTQIYDQVLLQCGLFWEVANVIKKLKSQRVLVEFVASSKAPRQWRSETLKLKRKDPRLFGVKLRKIKLLTKGKKSKLEVGSRCLWSYKNGPYRVVKVTGIGENEITIIALIQDDLCEISLDRKDPGLWKFSPEELYLIARHKYPKTSTRGSVHQGNQYFVIRDGVSSYDIATSTRNGYQFADDPSRPVELPKGNVYKGCTVAQIFEILHGRVNQLSQSRKDHDYEHIILRTEDHSFRMVKIEGQQGYTIVYDLHKKKISRPLSSKDILPVDPNILAIALKMIDPWKAFKKGKDDPEQAKREYADLVNSALEDVLRDGGKLTVTPPREAKREKKSKKASPKVKRFLFTEYSERKDLQKYLLGAFEMNRFMGSDGKLVKEMKEEYKKVIRQCADELAQMNAITPAERVPVHVYSSEVSFSGRRASSPIAQQSENIESKRISSDECYSRLVASCQILQAERIPRDPEGRLTPKSLVGTWINDKQKTIIVTEHDDGSLSFKYGRTTNFIQDRGLFFEVEKLGWKLLKSPVKFVKKGSQSISRVNQWYVEPWVQWTKGKKGVQHWLPKDHLSVLTPHNYKQVIASYPRTEVKEFATVVKNREANPKKGWKLKFHEQMTDLYYKLSDKKIKMKEISRDGIIHADRMFIVENIDYLWRHTNFSTLVTFYNLNSKKFRLEVGPYHTNLLSGQPGDGEEHLVRAHSLLRGVQFAYQDSLQGITGLHIDRSEQLLKSLKKYGDLFLFQHRKRANTYCRAVFFSNERVQLNLASLEGRGGAKVVGTNMHGIPIGSVIQDVNGAPCSTSKKEDIQMLISNFMGTDFYIKYYPKNSPYALEVGSEICLLTKEQQWRRVRVIKVDLTSNELKIEYIGFAARYNEWIDLTDSRLWCYSCNELYDLQVPQLEDYGLVASVGDATRHFDAEGQSIRASVTAKFSESLQLYSVRQKQSEKIQKEAIAKAVSAVFKEFDWQSSEHRIDRDPRIIRHGIQNAVKIIAEFYPMSPVDMWSDEDVQKWLQEGSFSKDMQLSFHGMSGASIRHLSTQELQREFKLTPGEARKFVDALHPERALDYKGVKRVFVEADPEGMGALNRDEFIHVCRNKFHFDHIGPQDLMVLFNLICNDTIVPKEGMAADDSDFEDEPGLGSLFMNREGRVFDEEEIYYESYENLQSVDYNQFYEFLEKVRKMQDDVHNAHVDTAKRKLTHLLDFSGKPPNFEEFAQREFEGTYLRNKWGDLFVNQDQIIEDHIRQQGALPVIHHIDRILASMNDYDNLPHDDIEFPTHPPPKSEIEKF